MNTSSTNKDSKLIAEAYSRIYLRVDENFRDEPMLPPKVKEFLERNRNRIEDRIFGEDENGKFIAIKIWEPYGDDDQIDEYYKMYFDAEAPLYIKQAEYEALMSHGQERAKS